MAPSTQTPGLLAGLLAKQALPGIGPTFPGYAPRPDNSGIAAAINTGGGLINSILQRKQELNMANQGRADIAKRAAGAKAGMQAAVALGPDATDEQRVQTAIANGMPQEDAQAFYKMLLERRAAVQAAYDKKADREAKLDAERIKGAAIAAREAERRAFEREQARLDRQNLKNIQLKIATINAGAEKYKADRQVDVAGIKTDTKTARKPPTAKEIEAAYNTAKQMAEDKATLMNTDETDFGMSEAEWIEKKAMEILGIDETGSAEAVKPEASAGDPRRQAAIDVLKKNNKPVTDANIKFVMDKM